jgi:hypothetical protein
VRSVAQSASKEKPAAFLGSRLSNPYEDAS